MGTWLTHRCNEEGLSLRQASIKCGLSHATMAALARGRVRPSPGTIRKLARFFSGDGATPAEVRALEDHLLTLAGHRTLVPEATKSETLSRVEAKLRALGERQLTLIEQFTDFVSSMEGK